MRLFTERVFQGRLVGAASPVVVYSLPQFEELMGEAEGVIVEVTLTEVSGTPAKFTAETQWSNTGSIWSPMSNGLIVIFNPANGVVTSAIGGDFSVGGKLCRLVMGLTGAGSFANVRAVVCGRAEQSWVQPNSSVPRIVLSHVS